jgi:two-component system nitrate/nitrite response regulator NarL
VANARRGADTEVLIRDSADVSTEPRHRVFIAEDHPVFAEALVRMVEGCGGLELVGRAADGESALAAIRQLGPHLAVVDLNLPRLGGLEVLGALEAEEEEGPLVMILTGSDDDEEVYRAVAAGARGVMSKVDSRAAITEAMIRVAAGETVVSPAFHGALAGQVRQRDRAGASPLSERETEVLRLTADGCSAAEAGELLHVAVPTVRTHLANIYEKLGVSSGPAAVAEGLRRGLVK